MEVLRCFAWKFCGNSLIPDKTMISCHLSVKLPVFTDKPMKNNCLSGERGVFPDKFFIFASVQVFNTQTYEYESHCKIFRGFSGYSESNLYGKSYTYTAIKTACPTGWRVPTKAEYESLMNYSRVVTYNNVKGRLFSGSKSYYVGPSIFLTFDKWEGFGRYWTSTTTEPEDISNGYYMFNCSSSSVWFSQGANSTFDCYIRCVTDK